MLFYTVHAGLQLRENTSKSLSVMVTTIFGLRECPFMTPDFRVGSCAQNDPKELDIIEETLLEMVW